MSAAFATLAVAFVLVLLSVGECFTTGLLGVAAGFAAAITTRGSRFARATTATATTTTSASTAATRLAALTTLTLPLTAAAFGARGRLYAVSNVIPHRLLNGGWRVGATRLKPIAVNLATRLLPAFAAATLVSASSVRPTSSALTLATLG